MRVTVQLHRRIRFYFQCARACAHCVCAYAEEMSSERRAAAERRRSERSALQCRESEAACKQRPALRAVAAGREAAASPFAHLRLVQCVTRAEKRKEKKFKRKRKRKQRGRKERKDGSAEKSTAHSGQDSSHARQLQLSLLRLIVKGRREIDSFCFRLSLSFAVSFTIASLIAPCCEAAAALACCPCSALTPLSLIWCRIEQNQKCSNNRVICENNAKSATLSHSSSDSECEFACMSASASASAAGVLSSCSLPDASPPPPPPSLSSSSSPLMSS